VTGAWKWERIDEVDVGVARKAVVRPDPRTGGQLQPRHLLKVPAHRDAIDLSLRFMSVLAESLPV
jgi:hypothetical protein